MLAKAADGGGFAAAAPAEVNAPLSSAFASTARKRRRTKGSMSNGPSWDLEHWRKSCLHAEPGSARAMVTSVHFGEFY